MLDRQTPHQTHALELQRFAIRVTPMRGADAKVIRRFGQRLDEYLLQRNLYFTGTPWVAIIRSNKRDLTVVDQIELLAWVLEDELCASVCLSPLTHCVATELGAEIAWVKVNRMDLTVAATHWLYRWGHLDASAVLRILESNRVTQVPI
ncbi:hypothetical protein [Paucibacter sp. Y2R2-4]|uniref:hypothetical protein n=1 Tax=Paucibacter sp. Y2R2-4 TaxID=2893553 RepID=UPI0021E515DC|nr:hypothetical protein [Paucibacter sp. Y2R2-4]MCV2351098.1 hypothetical protein [Paucibacter sp. Y2R2-4]